MLIEKKKKTIKMRRKIVKVRLSDNEIAKLQELADRHGIKTIAGYLRKAALNPEVFVSYEQQDAILEDFGSVTKMVEKDFGKEMKRIIGQIIAYLGEHESIEYSKTSDKLANKMEGDNFVLIFKEKKRKE